MAVARGAAERRGRRRLGAALSAAREPIVGLHRSFLHIVVMIIK